jgi:hypothetical protein
MAFKTGRASGSNWFDAIVITPRILAEVMGFSRGLKPWLTRRSTFSS